MLTILVSNELFKNKQQLWETLNWHFCSHAVCHMKTWQPSREKCKNVVCLRYLRKVGTGVCIYDIQFYDNNQAFGRGEKQPLVCFSSDLNAEKKRILVGIPDDQISLILALYLCNARWTREELRFILANFQKGYLTSQKRRRRGWGFWRK